MSRRQSFIELQQSAPHVLPSLLLCDFGNLAKEIDLLEAAGVRCLHLDVMDGNFVPNLTYGMPIVAGLRDLTELPLDVHLMIQQPERYIERFYEAGAHALTIHAEAVTNPTPVLQQIRDLGAASGLAFNPKTPLDQILPHLDACDMVLAMSVEPGFGGQKFNRIALGKLAALRAAKPNLLLEVDGGVNADTIVECAAAGADLLVVGSAIFKQDDYRTAVDRLHALIA